MVLILECELHAATAGCAYAEWHARANGWLERLLADTDRISDPSMRAAVRRAASIAYDRVEQDAMRAARGMRVDCRA